MYEIRDPIHGTILIDEEERRVVDDPWVQRLRHIRQLGFVSLVYPGAVHDRFQHSLGVMHLAGDRFARQARHPLLAGSVPAADLERCRRIARLAGLLHDVGHPPFSHTAEVFLPPVEAVRLPEGWYRDGQVPAGRQATHEDLTLAIIADLARRGSLDPDLARDVAAVLCPAVRRSARLGALGSVVGILRALVSGEIDADRGDYLLRDAHFLGVRYGVYDLSRLCATETVLPGPDGPELGLDIHGVHALEGLLMARYHMFMQVYFHKTPPAFEHYLEQAVAGGEVDLRIRGLDDLIDLHDGTVVDRITRAARQGAPWSTRIHAREPAKLILRERTGADQPENWLAQDLVRALGEAGCTVFQRRSRQTFTRLHAEGSRLLCERRVLGRPIVEPATAHSDLLARFHAPIDLRHTYVLRGDADRAAPVLERLQAF